MYSNINNFMTVFISININNSQKGTDYFGAKSLEML